MCFPLPLNHYLDRLHRNGDFAMFLKKKKHTAAANQ